MADKKLAKERKKAEELAHEMFVKNRNQKLADEMFGSKSQRLADQMFGKNRRQSAPGAAATGPRRAAGPATAGAARGLGGSLASRSGIRKVSLSLIYRPLV